MENYVIKDFFVTTLRIALSQSVWFHSSSLFALRTNSHVHEEDVSGQLKVLFPPAIRSMPCLGVAGEVLLEFGCR